MMYSRLIRADSEFRTLWKGLDAHMHAERQSGLPGARRLRRLVLESPPARMSPRTEPSTLPHIRCSSRRTVKMIPWKLCAAIACFGSTASRAAAGHEWISVRALEPVQTLGEIPGMESGLDDFQSCLMHQTCLGHVLWMQVNDDHPRHATGSDTVRAVENACSSGLGRSIQCELRTVTDGG